VLAALGRQYGVLAPTLPGHAGAQPVGDEVSDELLADAVEQAMDEAGFSTAHIVAVRLAATSR